MAKENAQEKSKRVSESRLWTWLSGTARKHYKQKLHMHRVENAVMSGMPDVEGCLCGIQFWIELKCAPRPSNIETKIKARFQPAQIPWLKARVRASGRAFVLLQVGSGAQAKRYLIPGHQANVLAAGCREDDLRIYSAIEPNACAVDIIQVCAYYAKF